MKNLVKKTFLKLMIPAVVLGATLNVQANEAEKAFPIFTTNGMQGREITAAQTKDGGIVRAKSEANELIQKNYNQYNLQCSTLNIQISIEHWGDGRGHHFYFWNETFFCTPRAFGEQALISLQISCFKNPQQECFNTTLLEKLNSVKPVQIAPDFNVKTYDMN